MGIGYKWRRLYPIYGKIAGVYDRTSRVVTLFLIDGWRKSIVMSLAPLLPRGARVLDAGAGPGIMSGLLLSARGDLNMLLMDQSIDMLLMAPRDLDKVVASFEEPPLRPASMHAVDNGFIGWLGRLYTMYIIPFLAFLVAGRRNASYFREINTIYDAMPPNRKLKELMETRFSTIRWTPRGLGTVFEYVGVKR